MLAPVGRLDLGLRFGYLIAAPFVLVALSPVVPVLGIAVSTAVATVIALIGSERWRARTAGIPVVGRFLAGFAKLGDHYAEHPPRPLLYYIAYPLLAPYWLISRPARREFLLYRKLNAVALVVLLALGARDYYANWAPEISLGRFAQGAFATLVIQLLVTFALVMPIATTVIAFHRAGARCALTVALVLAALAAGLAITVVARSDRPSWAATTRLRLRAAAVPAAAQATLQRALELAGPDLAARRPPVAARRELTTLWRPDEVRAFRFYRSLDGHVLVYANLRRHPPVFLARSPHGGLVTRGSLPADAAAQLQ